MRIVVASELPQDRSTLLVRIMAAGPGLSQAMADLAALPDDAHERTVALGILLRLQGALGKKARRTPDEEEFIVRIQDTWTAAIRRGRDEGRAEARADDVLTVLRARGIAVPDAVRERILAQRNPKRLERWLERAAVSVSIADVLDEPS